MVLPGDGRWCNTLVGTLVNAALSSSGAYEAVERGAGEGAGEGAGGVGVGGGVPDEEAEDARTEEQVDRVVGCDVGGVSANLGGSRPWGRRGRSG